MKSYFTNVEKVRSPIKYYRKILNITQKELAGEKYTRSYIQVLESGKRVPPYKCAVYLVKRMKDIAYEKKVKIDITADELIKNENQRIYNFLLNMVENIENDEIEEKDIKRYKELVSVINEHKFDELERKVNLLIADELLKCKKYIEAIEYYNKVLEKFKYSQYRLDEIAVLRKIGICFHMIQDYEKSIINYEKAEEIYTLNQLDNSDEYCKILLNISLAFKKNNETTKSIQYIKKALCVEDLNKKMLYNLKLQLGNNYQDIKAYEKALKIYEDLYIEYPEDYLLNYNLAITYHLLGKNNEIEKFLDKCMSSEFSNNENKSIYSLMLLGKLKLEKKDINNSEKCFNYAINIASKFKDGEMIMYTINNIYELLQKNGAHYEFLKYLDSITLNQELLFQNKSNMVKILVILVKCSIEIELSEKEKNKIKNIINIVERRIELC